MVIYMYMCICIFYMCIYMCLFLFASTLFNSHPWYTPSLLKYFWKSASHLPNFILTWRLLWSLAYLWRSVCWECWEPETTVAWFGDNTKHMYMYMWILQLLNSTTCLLHNCLCKVQHDSSIRMLNIHVYTILSWCVTSRTCSCNAHSLWVKRKVKHARGCVLQR